MSDLRTALDTLRQKIENLPSSATASQIGPLESEARDLLTRSKNTPFEEEARELFSQLSRLSAPAKANPEASQVRALLRRARIRIEIAGDDQDFDEAIDILAEALDFDPENVETHDLLMQAAQRSSQHSIKVRGLLDRYGLELEQPPTVSDHPPQQAAKPADTPKQSPPAPIENRADLDDRLSEIASTYYAGDYGRTVDLANRLLELDPKNNQALDYRQKAEDNLMRGVVPDHRIPFDARVAYNRANSLVRAGNYEEAERLYRTAREIATSAGIQSWQDVEQALLEIQDLALARELIADGDRLLAADDWQGALAKYEGSLRVVPNDPQAEERVGLVKKVQEQFDQAGVRLSMISGSLTERARGLVELLNMLAAIRQVLPGSHRLQQMVNDTQSRIHNVKIQLLEQAATVLKQVDTATAVEEKYRLATEARNLYQAAVELDPSDPNAATGRRQAEQLSAELNEGRQMMERAAALIAQNFDNELAQARQMLAGLRHNAQDPRYQQLVSDLLVRHLERVEYAIDRHDTDTANRWLSVAKEDPFRMLGRRTEILRLEQELRNLQQRRMLRWVVLGMFILAILAGIAYLNRDTIQSAINPTDTPTSTASSTATATNTSTATNTATATPTDTLVPDLQTATAQVIGTANANATATSTALTATAIQPLIDQTLTLEAINRTSTRSVFDTQVASTFVAQTQQASATIVAQTRQASATFLSQTEEVQATLNRIGTLTETFRPPTNTPTMTNTPTITPSPTEPQELCRIINGRNGNVNVRAIPSESGGIVGALGSFQSVSVYAVRRGLDDASVQWYQIEISVQGEVILGWVSSTVTNELSDCPLP